MEADSRNNRLQLSDIRPWWRGQCQGWWVDFRALGFTSYAPNCWHSTWNLGKALSCSANSSGMTQNSSMAWVSIQRPWVCSQHCCYPFWDPWRPASLLPHSHSLASKGKVIPAGNGPWITDAGRDTLIQVLVDYYLGKAGDFQVCWMKTCIEIKHMLKSSCKASFPALKGNCSERRVFCFVQFCD